MIPLYEACQPGTLCAGRPVQQQECYTRCQAQPWWHRLGTLQLQGISVCVYLEREGVKGHRASADLGDACRGSGGRGAAPAGGSACPTSCSEAASALPGRCCAGPSTAWAGASVLTGRRVPSFTSGCWENCSAVGRAAARLGLAGAAAEGCRAGAWLSLPPSAWLGAGLGSGLDAGMRNCPEAGPMTEASLMVGSAGSSGSSLGFPGWLSCLLLK